MYDPILPFDVLAAGRAARRCGSPNHWLLFPRRGQRGHAGHARGHRPGPGHRRGRGRRGRSGAGPDPHGPAPAGATRRR